MDGVFEALRADHYRHRMLARRLAEAVTPVDRARRLAELATFLERHQQAERPAFALALHASPDGRLLATRALRGQMELCRDLTAIGRSVHDAAAYDALVSAYRQEMERQLRLEEEELFPIAAAHLAEEAA